MTKPSSSASSLIGGILAGLGVTVACLLINLGLLELGAFRSEVSGGGYIGWVVGSFAGAIVLNLLTRNSWALPLYCVLGWILLWFAMTALQLWDGFRQPQLGLIPYIHIFICIVVFMIFSFRNTQT